MAKRITLAAGSVAAALMAAPIAVAQVGETWRENEDFDTAGDSGRVVETYVDDDDDVGVLSVGTVTDDTTGHTKIVIYEYRDNGGSATLEEVATIPDNSDPSAWHDWDFTAADAHMQGFGFAVCGNVVDPSTGEKNAVAVCYKILDIDDPLDRVWTTLLDPTEDNQVAALDVGGTGIAITGWIDSGGSTGRDYHTYLIDSGSGAVKSGWPVVTDRSSVDEAVDVVVFDYAVCGGGTTTSFVPTPGPLTENRIVVTGTTNPSTTKADITTVGYDDGGTQKWSKTFMGTFGSQQAYDTAAAISAARWQGECPAAEYWGAYVSGTSATASDAIPPGSDIITLAWGAMDGHPIWSATSTDPSGVRRLDSGNGADDRAFANDAVHVGGQDDAEGLWVAGHTPHPTSTTHVDFYVQQYDLATGAAPTGWPVTVAGDGGEDDVALAVRALEHSKEAAGDGRSRITGYGWPDGGTSFDFMTISLDGDGAFTVSGYPIFLDESGQGTDVAQSVIPHPDDEDDFFVLGTTTRSGSPPLDVTTVKYRDTGP